MPSWTASPLFVGFFSAHAAVQEGDDLAPGAVLVGAEVGGVGAVGDGVFYRPADGVTVEASGLYIAEGARAGGFGLAHGPPEEGDGLSPGAGAVGGEGGGGHAGGDALFHRPADGLVAIGACFYIGEGAFGCGRLRLAHGPPEEGDNLSPGAVGFGGEPVRGGAVGDAAVHCPQDGIVVETVRGHIGEGAGVVGIEDIHIAQDLVIAEKGLILVGGGFLGVGVDVGLDIPGVGGRGDGGAVPGAHAGVGIAGSGGEGEHIAPVQGVDDHFVDALMTEMEGEGIFALVVVEGAVFDSIGIDLAIVDGGDLAALGADGVVNPQLGDAVAVQVGEPVGDPIELLNHTIFLDKSRPLLIVEGSGDAEYIRKSIEIFSVLDKKYDVIKNMDILHCGGAPNMLGFIN